jgi:hypothetical protein
MMLFLWASRRIHNSKNKRRIKMHSVFLRSKKKDCCLPVTYNTILVLCLLLFAVKSRFLTEKKIMLSSAVAVDMYRLIINVIKKEYHNDIFKAWCCSSGLPDVSITLRINVELPREKTVRIIEISNNIVIW